MKRFTVFLSACLCWLSGFPQGNYEPSPVTAADLQLKTCSFDPDATAMVIYDIEESDITTDLYSSRMRTDRKVRIKIFNEKGYKHATVRIPYLFKRGYAKMKRLQGVVYTLNADGSVLKEELDRDDFFKNKAGEYTNIVNFTFPHLKPGSIIEYSYTTIENNILFILPWFIQQDIPVAYSSRTFTVPVDLRIRERPYGIDSLPQEYHLLKQDRFRRTTYYMKDLPAFHREPYMSSANDYLVRVSFSLGSSFSASLRSLSSSGQQWAQMGRRVLNSDFFNEQVLQPIPGTKELVDSAKKIESREERIRFLYESVQKRFDREADQSAEADSLLPAWTSREGTSAEINYILLNLLDHSNINCYPIMVSTRSNGKVNRDFPSMGQFNGVDVLAFDSTNYFILDASLRKQPYHIPPANVLNRAALVLSADSAQWIMVEDERPLLSHSISIFADMLPDGKLEGTATVQYFDYAKIYRLDTALQKEINGTDRFADKRPEGYKQLSLKQELPSSPKDPLTETIEFTYEPPNSGQFYFINAQLLTPEDINPFTASERRTDLDFGCNRSTVVNLQIQLPAGFQPDHLPKNMLLRAPDSSCLYRVSCNADKTTLYMTQVFETRRALFDKEEYPGLKDFFRQMYARMAEELVIKKAE